MVATKGRKRCMLDQYTEKLKEAWQYSTAGPFCRLGDLVTQKETGKKTCFGDNMHQR